jgi:hypothetical protein
MQRGEETIDELLWWKEMLKAMREERDRGLCANQMIYLPFHMQRDGERP